MEPMDLIRDKFSQDCTIETVLHLLTAHFDMSEENAQAEIDSHFEIVGWMDKHRDTWKEDLCPAENVCATLSPDTITAQILCRRKQIIGPSAQMIIF